jgi:rhodanese-related sulfurtransferase
MGHELRHITCKHLLELHGKEEKEHVVIDLRDVIEYEAGHIKGSVNVPRKELATNIHAVVPEKSARVIAIAGLTDANELAKIKVELEELGYTNMEFLAGGFDEWCELAPLEVEPELTELTPEEEGFTGKAQESEEEDPREENQPLY